MIIKGYKTRKSNTLGYRMGNPEKDKDLHGYPVSSNYVVFVKIADCAIYEKDDQKYYKPDNAKSIPVAYGGTFYGYGKLKKLTNFWKEVSYYRTVYFAWDAKVYTARITYTEKDEIEHQKEIDKRDKKDYKEALKNKP